MRMDAGELQAAEAAIIDLCGGIQPPLEIFYIQSIIYAAERSFSAFERFDAAVTRGMSDALIFATVQEA